MTTPAMAEIHGLTGRQKEVLSYVALGWSNIAIAKHLGLSEHTIRAHLRAMFDRVQVHSRTELVYRCGYTVVP